MPLPQGSLKNDVKGEKSLTHPLCPPTLSPSPARLELMMLEKRLPISLHLWATASETNHPICISL